VRSILIQVTGLADVPCPALGDKTPLEAATTPALDALAGAGILGLTRAVPEEGLVTISNATAAILGVEPRSRALAPGAAAALGVGVEIPAGGWAACLDLCAVAEQEGAGPAVCETRFPGIGYDDGTALAASLDEAVAETRVRVHRGVAARHVLVGAAEAPIAFDGPPDLAIGQALASILPAESRGVALRNLMSRARATLWEYPVCSRLRAQGETVPTDVWPWGAGTATSLPSFEERFGLRAAAVATSPIVRGVARACGLAVEPDLAGGLPTLAARVERALALGADYEFVLLHVEFVDDAGPRGDAAAKVDAITRFDAEVVGPVTAALRADGGDWRLTVMADVTSASPARRYTSDPVPFVVASPRDAGRSAAVRRRFVERQAREQGVFLGEAHTLLERLLRR
jgi:2,3-bisphosphoglycerate-independent phosphoglycerate mutase